MGTDLTSTRLRDAGIGAFFRPRDVRPLGISFRHIRAFVADGGAEKVGDGLYRRSDVEPTELETVAMVASAAPKAIVCLLTALRVHEIGTQAPRAIWIALDRKSRKPRRMPTSVRIVRFSGAMLTYGIVHRSMQGVPVRITSPARTVVDCFRYRKKLGLDVAMEALQDAVRSRRTTVDGIVRAAEACRIITVIGPYLDALSV
jgi:predicted transcriptional regulator of viral defense system